MKGQFVAEYQLAIFLYVDVQFFPVVRHSKLLVLTVFREFQRDYQILTSRDMVEWLRNRYTRDAHGRIIIDIVFSLTDI